MKEGKIVAWHKKVGDTVKNDDVLADVETDKATMEVMGYADGTLLHIGVPEGQAAKINDIIAIIGKAGTDIQGILDSEGEKSAAEHRLLNKHPKQRYSLQTTPSAAASTMHRNRFSSRASQPRRRPVKGFAACKASCQRKKASISPTVKGSGDGGRIIKRDVDEFKPSASSASQRNSCNASNRDNVCSPVTPTHRFPRCAAIIAQRLSESMFTAPHFYLRMTVTMDAAITARKAINDVSTTKVSFNDLIIKACAMALRKHPEVNSSWTGEAIRQNHHINIGTAVAVDEGLIVPVVKGADGISLSQIAEEASVSY